MAAPASDDTQPLLARQNSRQAQEGDPRRQQSHFFVPKDSSYEVLNGLVPTNVRNDFIKKVYLILTAELLWTAAVCCVFMFYAPLREGTIAFMKQHNLLYQIVMFGSLMASVCALMMKKNEYPTNYQLTFVFVTIMACNIGCICAMFYAAGWGIKIAQAFGITSVVFITLSAYAHISKQDFSFMGGFLIVALVANILFGLVAMYTGSTWGAFIYHVAGVMIFCGFILYDTSALIHVYGCDDYIIASIELYLDFINLFLHILALMSDN